MAINTLQDFRNGRGYIYITQADGSTIVTVYPNNSEGGDLAHRFAYLSAPLAGQIAATGRITLGGAAGSITSITVNGVNILGSTATGASLADIAIDAANKINTYSSTPDYTAAPSGDDIIIFAAPSAGSSPNNFVVAAATAGGLTYTAENMRGGSDTSGLIDAAYGYRVFLNADYDADGCSGEGTADPTSLTNAVQITKYLVNRGFQNDFIKKSVIISSGSVEITRESSITIVDVDTEGGGASDDLQTIGIEGFNENDLIIIRGTNAGRVVTVKDYVGGSDNIYLANDQDFDTGNNGNVIALRLKSGAWYEEYRSPFTEVTVAFLRSVGIAMPVQGVAYTALPTSGNISLTPGTDKQYQIYGGSPTLVGNIAIDGAGSPMDGDEFWVDYNATANTSTGTYTVSIFGIVLTDTQATSGNVLVYAKYRAADNSWYATIIQDSANVDFLTSLTPYSRVLESVTSGAANTASALQQTLATYTMPANTFANDQSVIKIKAYFTAAANANTKRFSVYFGATQVALLEGTVNNNVVIIEANITRLSSTTQFANGLVLAEGGFLNVFNSSPAEDVTANIDIDFRAEVPSATASDITLNHYTVEYVAKV